MIGVDENGLPTAAIPVSNHCLEHGKNNAGMAFVVRESSLAAGSATSIYKTGAIGPNVFTLLGAVPVMQASDLRD